MHVKQLRKQEDVSGFPSELLKICGYPGAEVGEVHRR